jgi:hypothetical protein
MDQAIRDRIAALKTQTRFPVANLLQLYYAAAQRDVYCKNFRGFKLLKEFLAPIDYNISGLAGDFPSALGGYETQELSKILGISHRHLCEVIYNESKLGHIRER